jgi:tetratricopeptide (TPR) repeat protein
MTISFEKLACYRRRSPTCLPRLLSVVFLFSGLISCGARPAAPQSDSAHGRDAAHRQEPVRLEPFHLHVLRTEDSEGKESAEKIEAYDAGELFRRASVAYQSRQYEPARKLYRRVADEFPLSEYAPAALYNLGLSHEQLREYASARDAYAHLIDNYPDSKDVTDALFRLLGCMEALDLHKDAVRIADELLFERSELTGLERVECLARKGAALVKLGEDETARQSLEEAVYRFKSQKDVSPQMSPYFAAMARFKLGEILEKKMHAAPLPADESLLRPALEEKCELLLAAQREYTESIRFGEAHWAAAAAYRTGELYRTLWEDMLHAPAPTDMNPEEQEIYRQLIKERIQILLEKALRQWGRVIKMAERLDFNNEWVEQARQDIVEIRALTVRDNDAALLDALPADDDEDGGAQGRK